MGQPTVSTAGKRGVSYNALTNNRLDKTGTARHSSAAPTPCRHGIGAPLGLLPPFASRAPSLDTDRNLLARGGGSAYQAGGCGEGNCTWPGEVQPRDAAGGAFGGHDPHQNGPLRTFGPIGPSATHVPGPLVSEVRGSKLESPVFVDDWLCGLSAPLFAWHEQHWGGTSWGHNPLAEAWWSEPRCFGQNTVVTPSSSPRGVEEPLASDAILEERTDRTGTAVITAQNSHQHGTCAKSFIRQRRRTLQRALTDARRFNGHHTRGICLVFGNHALHLAAALRKRKLGVILFDASLSDCLDPALPAVADTIASWVAGGLILACFFCGPLTGCHSKKLAAQQNTTALGDADASYALDWERHTARVLSACKASHTAWAEIHPPCSPLWSRRARTAITNDARTVVFDQCQFGIQSRRRTRLTAYPDAPRSLRCSQLCLGKPCCFSGRKRLIPRFDNTKMSTAWICKQFALLLAKDFVDMAIQFKMNERWAIASGITRTLPAMDSGCSECHLGLGDG